MSPTLSTPPQKQCRVKNSLSDVGRIACGAGPMQRLGVRMYVCPLVCPVDRHQQRRVAGLLLSALWAPRTRYRSTSATGARGPRVA